MASRREATKDKDQQRVKKLKNLWLVSFLFAVIASDVYKAFYDASPASPFPTVQSAVLAVIFLLYFYPLTISMRDAAKRANRKKLYTFSRVMAIYFSVAGVFVISYIVIALIK